MGVFNGLIFLSISFYVILVVCETFVSLLGFYVLSLPCMMNFLVKSN